MSPSFYSGNESWVFTATTLDQLCGHHAGLATATLGLGEPPLFMVYAPRRDATGAPFGVRTSPGSHALVVTETRAIITHDPHRADRAPTAHVAAWDDVLAIEIGEALTLGWLSLVVRRNDHLARLAIPFAATGIEHFRAVVRWWRQRFGEVVPGAGDLGAGDEGVAAAPAFLKHAVAGVLGLTERLTGMITGDQVHGRSRNGAPACPAALCGASRLGLVLAESQLPCHRTAVAFGVNLTCVAWREVQDVRGGRVATGDATYDTLVVTARSGDLTHRFEVPLGGVPTDRIVSFAADLRRLASGVERTRTEVCQ